jgi:GR25 family glycosyltransferase involved in LPS biosynthesis
MIIKQNKVLIAFLAILVVIAIMYGIQDYTLKRRPHVKDIWVINLEKDVKRMSNIRSNTGHISDIVHRWPATNGKILKREDIHNEGVGYAMTRTGVQSDDLAGKLRNAGVVGCWLSHKRLLIHLASLDVPEYYGHLVLEDDVHIPSDFLLRSDEWHKVYTRVPTDWDMVYFGLTNPIGVPIGERLIKAKKAYPGMEGNWGTHAYLVRHGSLKTKILPWLDHMVDAIDEQYNLKFNDWNIYVIEPSIIKLDEELSKNSSLLKMNVDAKDDQKLSY